LAAGGGGLFCLTSGALVVAGLTLKISAGDTVLPGPKSTLKQVRLNVTVIVGM